MSEYGSKNLYAPPRAEVHDHAEPEMELVQATRLSRFLAILIDCVPGFVIGLVAGIVFAVQMATHTGGRNALTIMMSLFGLATVALVIYYFVLIYRYGQTFGKKVMGIRMVRTDGSRMSLKRFFFIRCLPIGLLGAIPFIGYFVTLANYLAIFRNPPRCLHDNIADTMVVTAESSPHATLAGSRGEHLRTISF